MYLQAMPYAGRLWRNTVLWRGLAALVPFAVFAALALMTAFGNCRQSDWARLRETARALAAAEDAQLDSLISVFEVFATSEMLDGLDYLQTFDDRARPLARQLDSQVFLLGPGADHQVLASTGLRPSEPWPKSLRSALESTISTVLEDGKPAISDLFQVAADPRFGFTVMIPVDREGQPRRVLGLRFEPSALRALLVRQDLPQGTFAAIADSNLRILAHSRDPEGHRLGASAPDWVASAIEGRQRIVVSGPGWSNQEDVYAVERLLRHGGWTVTVAEPQSIQQSSAWNAVCWLLCGGSALAIGLIVVVWSSRRVAVWDARREAEALRAGRSELERLLAGLPALIFLHETRPDGASVPLFRGGDIERVTGWPAAKILKLPDLDELIHRNDSSFGSELPCLLRESQVAHEFRIRQPDGQIRVLQTAARVLARHGDGRTEVVSYTVDVTALREAEARVQASTQLAALGELAAGLAHELRQPLATVAMAADNAAAALDDGDEEDVRKRLERIKVQTSRAASLIERLRRFSRGTEKGAPVEDVPLDAAIDAALELTRVELEVARVEVDVKVENPPPVARGYALLVEQVLSNLLLNARDALSDHPPGADRRICIDCRGEPGETVRLTVSDTGGGIPSEVMARLYEPFVTTKKPERGTGLGLSICNALVKEMSGTIMIRNAVAGAVVDIVLPAAAHVKPAQSEPEDADSLPL